MRHGVRHGVGQIRDGSSGHVRRSVHDSWGLHYTRCLDHSGSLYDGWSVDDDLSSGRGSDGPRSSVDVADRSCSHVGDGSSVVVGGWSPGGGASRAGGDWRGHGLWRNRNWACWLGCCGSGYRLGWSSWRLCWSGWWFGRSGHWLGRCWGWWWRVDHLLGQPPAVGVGGDGEHQER